MLREAHKRLPNRQNRNTFPQSRVENVSGGVDARVSTNDQQMLAMQNRAIRAALLAIFAKFEMEILRERTGAGLSLARENGKAGQPLPPSTLRKSGNCIAPSSANPRLPASFRSTVPRSGESRRRFLPKLRCTLLVSVHLPVDRAFQPVDAACICR